MSSARRNEPTISLADEPTGSLDAENTGNVMEMFDRVRKEFGTTIVLATHDRELARHSTFRVHLESGKAIVDRPDG